MAESRSRFPSDARSFCRAHAARGRGARLAWKAPKAPPGPFRSVLLRLDVAPPGTTPRTVPGMHIIESGLHRIWGGRASRRVAAAPRAAVVDKFSRSLYAAARIGPRQRVGQCDSGPYIAQKLIHGPESAALATDFSKNCPLHLARSAPAHISMRAGASASKVPTPDTSTSENSLGLVAYESSKAKRSDVLAGVLCADGYARRMRTAVPEATVIIMPSKVS